MEPSIQRGPEFQFKQQDLRGLGYEQVKMKKTAGFEIKPSPFEHSRSCSVRSHDPLSIYSSPPNRSMPLMTWVVFLSVCLLGEQRETSLLRANVPRFQCIGNYLGTGSSTVFHIRKKRSGCKYNLEIEDTLPLLNDFSSMQARGGPRSRRDHPKTPGRVMGFLELSRSSSARVVGQVLDE